jgi:hypothetical protein
MSIVADVTVLHSTSIKVLMPHILRIVASHQPGSHIKDLLKLCSTETVITSDPPSEVNGNSELSGRRRKVGLLAALWGDHDLDTKRLRFVLAQWSAVRADLD